jgi:APA family basic amino acid/polyamine antiporter
MFWKQLVARKSLELLAQEAKGENRLRRVLGPVGLTSLGVGAIIGAGIFVMTGRAAANDAGPAIMLSYAFAGVGCALAAFCYAEFASLAPVAGSAYTYAYATLGELLAWIIGWDLVLEYAMSCATVAASWSKYFNAFLEVIGGDGFVVPDYLCHDPFSHPGAWFNLPAVLILALVTTVLVIGIRESAASNTVLVLVKLGVVLFVIVMGARYVKQENWTGIPEAERKTAEQIIVGDKADAQAKQEDALFSNARKWAAVRFDKEKVEQVVLTIAVSDEKDTLQDAGTLKLEKRAKDLKEQALATYMLGHTRAVADELTRDGKWSEEKAKERVAAAEKEYAENGPKTPAEKARVEALLVAAKKEAPAKVTEKWGMLGYFGINKYLESVDNAVRSPFIPYGLSGLMLGASIVFFAFIGFDSISTHSEEARNPQRDVPIGILASLFLCTALYMAVAAVITGMVPYPKINVDAAVSKAFSDRAVLEGGNQILKASAGLIAAGALAGMTSVLLITFLSQARVFLAMARDKLLPPAIFGAVHEKFKTPHISTMLTGIVICVVAAFTPITILEDMVNIGTLFAFVVVCGAVLLLRIRRPEVYRPFRCPGVFVVAPLGIVVNLIMMLFLPVETWIRLVVWLFIGLVIYFTYSYRHSSVGKTLRGRVEPQEA